MSSSRTSSPVAVVTGASRGLGQAIAVELARQGWDVALSYVSQAQQAQATAAQVRDLGQRALVVQADVSDSTQVQQFFAQVAAELGPVNGLVNNAGIVGQPRSILDAEPAHLAQVFDTNVLSAFYCIREAARVMSTQRGGKGGVMVNMSSAAARHGGMPNEAHYASSKAAIDGLTLALAKELAPHGIRINAVRPGLIQTGIHDIHGGQALIDKVAPTVPLGRAGEPAEVADVVAFLLGPKSSYVHGALIDISGGR